MTRKKKSARKSSGKNYCRKCQRTIALYNFYEATNLNLDTNGYMSICKKCCNELYQTYFAIYNNVEMALDYTCRDLDVRFSKNALSQTQTHMDSLINKGKDPVDITDKIFGYYKSKLSSTAMRNMGMESLRYKDSDSFIENLDDDAEQERKQKIYDRDEELIQFWGMGFSLDEYEFLEAELANWKQTHKCDNQAEITLLKEICIKILTIRNKRALEENVSADVKELQDLFKTASVDPAKANVASAGKLQDTWGVWVKDIEKLRPAEWHEQQEKYQDMDGFVSYIKDYIVRPISNFITGNRDFQISDNINVRMEEE